MGASPNNSVLQNVYNIKAPKELKGGKPFYFVMVNNVSDSKSYTNVEDAATRLDELRKMNPRAKVGIAKSNQRIDNPINNILRNFDAGVTSVLTNVVASRAVRDLQRLGLAQRIPTPNRVEPTPDVVVSGLTERQSTTECRTSFFLLRWEPLVASSLRVSTSLLRQQTSSVN